MLAFYKKEMRSYFTTPIGYVFVAIFLLVGGAMFSYTTLYSMTSNMSAYFTYMMLMLIILLPILTMKSFTEEKKMRTEQLLLTSPVPITSIVLGKFLAAYTMFAGSFIFNSLYFLILYRYAEVKTGLLIGNILAMLLLGMSFIAIGLYISALTENQLAAAIGTIAVLLLLLGIGLINMLLPDKYWLRYVIDCISVFTRFQTFTNGYFDFASLIYYLSISGIFVYLTVRVYDKRRYS